METKLTPRQALCEYFRQRQKAHNYLRHNLSILRYGSRRTKRAFYSDILRHITFLRDITTFIINHRELSQPSAQELNTLTHDLYIYESRLYETITAKDT
ncbi:MAG: hypothetical protein Q4A24_00100 [Akkermansia sp.]|nr:hypothetical protein [Akkermansia sp.]